MDFSCDLHDVGIKSKRTCMPSSPGTGSTMYLFNIDECFPTMIPRPKKGIWYDWDDLLHGCDGTKNEGIAGRCFGVKIKPNSGHPTGTREQGNKMASQGYEVLVDSSIEDYADIDFKIAALNVGVLVSDNGGNAYVFMSPNNELLYNSDFDGGQEYNSDHGITATFTYAPAYHVLNKVEVPEGLNLNTLLSSNTEVQEASITFTTPANGTLAVTQNGAPITSGSKVKVGSFIDIVATPSKSYRIDTVSITVGTDTSVSTDTKTHFLVTGDTSITAVFESNS